MPAEYPHLPNAPIVEALLDLRTVLSSDVDVRKLGAVSSELRRAYPTEHALHTIEARVSVSGTEARIDEAPTSVRGHVFHSPDDLYRVQFRQDGFTFHRLQPYTDWDDVTERARRAWEEYLTLAEPLAVTRIAARYINRFELPVPVELRDYLVSPPELPPKVPQALGSFLWRWVVKDEATGIMCNLSQASERVTAAPTVGIVIDIDCYVAESLNPGDRRVFEWLAQLRELKNRIFFGSLTSRALELFT